jgi:hypothetical protein
LHESLDPKLVRVAQPLHDAVGGGQEKLDSVSSTVKQPCFRRHFSVKPLAEPIRKSKCLDDSKGDFIRIWKGRQLALVVLGQDGRIEPSSDHIGRHIDLTRALVAKSCRGAKRVAPEFLGAIGSECEFARLEEQLGAHGHSTFVQS